MSKIVSETILYTQPMIIKIRHFYLLKFPPVVKLYLHEILFCVAQYMFYSRITCTLILLLDTTFNSLFLKKILKM